MTQRRFASFVSVLFALMLSSSLVAFGSGADLEQASPAEAPPPAASDAKLLFDEEELPGRYYFGDGLGVNYLLTLDTDHRFIFTWDGCLGEYARNAGVWALNGDILILTPDEANQHEGFGTNVRFIPVKWGKRHYLIDEHEMPGFCVAAANEELPAVLDYIKCDGSQQSPVEGAPLIPTRYQEFYEKGPIVATVVRIDEDENAVLDKGTGDRLKPGMLLAINAFARIDLKVISTTSNEAVARPLYFRNSGHAVKVGDRFTTGSYWHRPAGTGKELLVQLPNADP